MSVRHDRRRRFLGDDTPPAGPLEESESAARGGGAPREPRPDRRAYADAASTALDRPIRDFFPSSYLAMILATCGLLLLVSVIELAHFWRPPVDGLIGAGGQLFDLTASGNCGRWFAAMLLAAASLVALFIYSLRRHRVDDYHGRYRVWIWTAMACLGVSLGEASSLPTLVRELCSRAAAACGTDEAIVWPAVAATLLGLGGLRLLVEMWRCRAAAALLTLAAVSLLTAVGTDRGWITGLSDEQRLLLERGTWLAGYVGLLVTLLVYARYVRLEIEGKIAVIPAKPRPPKAKKSRRHAAVDSADEPPRKSAANVRTDLEPTPSRPAAPSPNSAVSQSPATSGPRPGGLSSGAASNANGNGGEARNGQQPQRHLSRAERRRLRREAQMQAR